MQSFSAFLNLGVVIIQAVSLKEWYSGVRSQPFEIVIGLPVFFALAAGGAVEHVASVSFFILFLACLVHIKSWRQSWQQLTSYERWVLLGFGLYFFSAVTSYVNVSDEHTYVKHLGRYAKFLLVIPVYLMVSKSRLNLWPYLIAGAIISGPVYLVTALLSVAESPLLPAKGSYHHITFGDMAMLNALFMMVLLVTMGAGKVIEESKYLKITLFASILCLLYASVLSQARGAWLALPICLFLLMCAAVWYGKIRKRTILVALIVFGIVIAMTPAKDIVSGRMQSVVHEIELFQSGVDLSSSIGDRLAMWHIAVNVWQEHPVLGSGPGDFSGDILATQKQGMYVAIHAHETAHNIFLHALATTGAVGFAILCSALFIFPLRLFYKVSASGVNVAGLSGVIILAAFAVFGLTETWVLRSPPISIFLLFYVALATICSQVSVADSELSDK